MPYVQRYTSQRLLDELRRAAGLVDGAVTMAQFEAHTGIAAATVRRRFGSWRSALTKAGLRDGSAHRTISPKMRQPRNRMSRENLIIELQAIAERVGTDAITHNHVRDYSDLIGSKVLTTRFGSFTAAVKAAGLRRSKTAARYTDRQLASNLRKVTAQLDRPPIRTDMDRPPSVITSKTYVHRFGSWTDAIKALTSI